MSGLLKVRNAGEADFESIYSFINDLQGKTFDKSLLEKIFKSSIDKTDNLHLVAIEGDEVVGYLSCHLQFLLHHGGKVAEIQEMYVKPEKRSGGIGKLLMKEVKERAKKAGAVQLEVTTRIIREKAIQFYVREGFEDSHKKLVHYF